MRYLFQDGRQSIKILMGQSLLSQTRLLYISYLDFIIYLPLLVVKSPLLKIKQGLACTQAYIIIYISRIIINFYMLSKINLNLNTKNKAIQEYKAKHQQIQNMLEKTNEKYERSRNQINVQCLSINQTLGKLKNKSKQFVASCRQALDDIKTGQIIDMKDLSQYLKKQKELLKNIAQQKQNKQQNKMDLHEILSKVQLQRVLTKIKRIQLQQQIKFLQSNVIVKGNFIYNPSNSLFISPTQDKQSNQKLSNSIQQLQRLIQLSIPCVTNTNLNNKLLALQSQYSRIQECQILITEEHLKLIKFTQFIQQRKSSIEKFSLKNTSIGTDIQQQQIDQASSFQELRVDENELDSLLQLHEQPPLIINMEHPFVSIDEKINQLRVKIKKVQKIF